MENIPKIDKTSMGAKTKGGSTTSGGKKTKKVNSTTSGGETKKDNSTTSGGEKTKKVNSTTSGGDTAKQETGSGPGTAEQETGSSAIFDMVKTLYENVPIGVKLAGGILAVAAGSVKYVKYKRDQSLITEKYLSINEVVALVEQIENGHGITPEQKVFLLNSLSEFQQDYNSLGNIFSDDTMVNVKLEAQKHLSEFSDNIRQFLKLKETRSLLFQQLETKSLKLPVMTLKSTQKLMTQLSPKSQNAVEEQYEAARQKSKKKIVARLSFRQKERPTRKERRTADSADGSTSISGLREEILTLRAEIRKEEELLKSIVREREEAARLFRTYQKHEGESLTHSQKEEMKRRAEHKKTFRERNDRTNDTIKRVEDLREKHDNLKRQYVFLKKETKGKKTNGFSSKATTETK